MSYAPLILLVLLGVSCTAARTDRSSAFHQDKDDDVLAQLRQRSDRAEGLDWLRAWVGAHPWLASKATRSDVIEQKYRAIDRGDAARAARMNAVLSAEAQTRASLVLVRWMSQLDPQNGLLPKGRAAEDRVWDYADTGADLFPHLLIAATLLEPRDAPALTRIIDTEQAISSTQGLPSNINLNTDKPEKQNLEDRVYGSVEYAKDGLLPLLERLGPGPWSDRMLDIARRVDAAEPQSTRFGSIPSDSSEVNGQALQILSRAYWLTRDDELARSGGRLTRAYLDLALPSTGMIPGRTWDFDRERGNTQQAQLRDHGNEIVAGLVEFHLVESALAIPEIMERRQDIHDMLGALLKLGRTKEGLWKSAIDFETGESLKDTLSDNWGYLFAAYLTQAMIEDRYPGGDPVLAAQYRAAAERGLNAAADLDLYPWQGVEQDGYADTIESALYLIDQISAPRAERWVDRQAGTLFGAQDEMGRVEDRYLDGNFVRTALLYSGWQTQGARVEPWNPGVLLGATPSGDCVQIALGSAGEWDGRVIFDAPRSRTNLHLPMAYPRLNGWPEWFTAEATGSYTISDVNTAASWSVSGADLQDGLQVSLEPGAERDWTVCRT